MSRLSIRARFTILAAAVATVLLVAAMATVVLIERSHTHDSLLREARQAAAGLAESGRDPSLGHEAQAEHGGEATGDAGSDGSGGQAATLARVTRYLESREGSTTLLLVELGSQLRSNNLAARDLQGLSGIRPGGQVDTTLNGTEYIVAATRVRSNGLALAAVPSNEASAEIRRLLRAMLIVGLAALVPTLLVAWLAAGRALAPLTGIAGRASRITAGDLSERVGPVATHDEVAGLAAAIDQMLDRLENAFAAQTRFVHDASHELRTPLTIARGHLEVALLGHERVDPALREAIELAIGEIDRMTRLVESLLRLARLEGETLRREIVRLNDLAAASIDRSRSLADRAWLFQPQAGDALEVPGDRDALEQVMLNLLANAARHTSAGGQITVTTRRLRGSVEIAVSDDGEGIPAEALPSIFDRFTRADAARTRDGGGTGLGLAICREILAAHGGSIRVTSTPGRGATFTITLPAR